MCKILILTGHHPAQRNHLIRTAWRYFDRSRERDGFGAAWISASGRLAHIRSSAPTLTDRQPDWCDGWHHAENTKEASNGGPLLIHGRTATCGKGLTNTHPMLVPNHALIHNGVVSSDEYRNESTTCDSELILRALLAKSTDGLAAIRGYFAFAHLDLTARRLTIARDDQAGLYSAKIPGHGWAFGTTTEAVAIATTACPVQVKDNVAVSFDTRKPHRPLSISTITKAPPKPRVEYQPQFDTDWPATVSEHVARRHHRAATLRDVVTQ
jgi:hypothetical protein